MGYAIKIENLSKKYVIRHGASNGSLKELAEHFKKNFQRKFLSLKTTKNSNDPFDITYEEFWALKDLS